MKRKLIMGMMSLLMILAGTSMVCHAEIAGDDAFANLTWEQVFEDNLLGESGVVQSICATEDYYVMIENISDKPDEPDIVSAYYRNDTDENGNPVQPFTLAKRTADTNWEHGNGMTYNPNTHEIYVALYTNAREENRGCLFVMDPDTLAYKRTIKISDEYNILGIDYDREKNQYVIQTNVEGGYSFKILDADFNLVDDLGEYAHTAPGNNFQDLVVSGDYIINFPLTLGLGIGDFIHAYSISQRTMAASEQTDFQLGDMPDHEAESLCEIEPGVFLAAVNGVDPSGVRKIRLYKTQVPYYFNVSVTSRNGEIIAENEKVLKGETYTFHYRANDEHELSKLNVNGEKISPDVQTESFTLENVQSDLNIEAVFSKVPVVEAKPAVLKKQKQSFPYLSFGPVMVIVCTGLAGIGFYSYVLHVRRERKRKYVRAKRRQPFISEY